MLLNPHSHPTSSAAINAGPPRRGSAGLLDMSSTLKSSGVGGHLAPQSPSQVESYICRGRRKAFIFMGRRTKAQVFHLGRSTFKFNQYWSEAQQSAASGGAAGGVMVLVAGWRGPGWRGGGLAAASWVIGRCLKLGLGTETLVSPAGRLRGRRSET